MWLNLTLFNQSALFSEVRQLEHALLQLTHQVDELLMAVKHMLSEKLPLTITSPRVFHNILRNISVFPIITYSLPVPDLITFTCITD